jgi:low temperature requirement protein LtrA
VSWVELYLDLVFVLAVAQLAHLIVDEPELSSVWIALGLFVVLWWTWVGFAVLYNRHGADRPSQRLLFLAGSVPAGVAAVAIDRAATGDSAVFAVALAVTRVVLALAHHATGDTRVTRALLLSAVLFAVSAFTPEPFRYVLWALAISAESGATLVEDRAAARRARRDHDLTALRPTDPAEALEPHHFAERFGLFLIILLGEVVVEAGQVPAEGAGGWAAVVAVMIFAGGLWWLYFDAAVDVNLKVLDLSGGSPTTARAIFAVGHMLPAFSLLMMAAGVGLLLEEEPPDGAYALLSLGLGIYLLGTRVFLQATRHVSGVARVLVLVATFFLARLFGGLSPHEYVWLVSAWVVMCAALTTRHPRLPE